MKLVVSSDLHLDSAFAWISAGSQAARRRRDSLRATLRRILDFAWSERADAVLCGGDLYEHERFTPDTASFLRASFDRVSPLKVFIAPGNHDFYGPGSIYNSVMWSPNVTIFDSSRLTPITLSDGLTLWGAAHRVPAGTTNFLKEFKVDRGGVNIALFHGSELGDLPSQGSSKSPHAPFRAEEIERAGLSHAFLGHYHRPRDAERHTYPGNPDPLSFGEDGPRGIVIATIQPDGSVTRIRKNVSSTTATDLTVDVTGCASRQEVSDRVHSAIAGIKGVARITLEGELPADVDLKLSDLERLPSNLDGYQVRFGNISLRYDFKALANEPTVRGQFVKDVLSAELADDERRRVLVTGLRALEGRDDLEVF